jgi:uncharacterized membrane protein
VARGATGGPHPGARAVGWGLAAGRGGGAGTLILYRGLARGQMSVVGPVSAVAAAAVPAGAGLALGERPPMLALAGIVVALPAITLVAASGGRARSLASPALLDGLGAGVAFGILFIALAQAGQNAGLWPVACEQAGSLLVVLAAAARTRVPLRAAIRLAGWPALAGASGMTATLLYYDATHHAMLTTAAVLVSLYPAVTVLLARTILGERFSPVQRAGLGLCTLAIIAITLN